MRRRLASNAIWSVPGAIAAEATTFPVFRSNATSLPFPPAEKRRLVRVSTTSPCGDFAGRVG